MVTIVITHHGRQKSSYELFKHFILKHVSQSRSNTQFYVQKVI
jgi:hypothetical protein